MFPGPQTGTFFPASNSVAPAADRVLSWEPEPVDRVLILAPHPDDEVLGAGGVIATFSKLHAAGNVRVIVATNGDASFATAIFHGSHTLSKRNFRRQAMLRQLESLEALACLGLDAAQVRFWGFPDRGLASLWHDHPKLNRPYHSRTTGYSSSTQALNSPILPFSGANLLAVLRRELLEFRPSIVIMPHPQDRHADHRALAAFTLFAAADCAEQVSPQLPMYFAYWMWRDAVPFLGAAPLKGRSRYPVSAGLPPVDKRRLNLARDVQLKKVRALRCYSSQKVGAGKLLLAAARSDYEIFTLLHPAPQPR